MITDLTEEFMRRAIQLANQAENAGNLPIGAVIALEDKILAEGQNSIFVPIFHPGRHAEIEALSHIPSEYWKKAHAMTCYTTLEPCVMCMGALLGHGVGRVVFGALDPIGGAGKTLQSLPEYFTEDKKPSWIGPVMPETCAPLFQRAFNKFQAGQSQI